MPTFLAVLFALIVTNISAQTNALTGTQLRVFKTYADVLANKPVEGLEVTNEDTKVGRKEAMALKENGTERTITAEEFGYYAYTDGSGLFIRPSDGKFYYILVPGKYSYYFCTCEGSLSVGSKGQLIILPVNGGKNFFQYTSDGPEGKIEYSKQTVKQVLKDEPELLEGFKQEVGMGTREYSYERELEARMLAPTTDRIEPSDPPAGYYTQHFEELGRAGSVIAVHVH